MHATSTHTRIQYTNALTRSHTYTHTPAYSTLTRLYAHALTHTRARAPAYSTLTHARTHLLSHTIQTNTHLIIFTRGWYSIFDCPPELLFLTLATAHDCETGFGMTIFSVYESVDFFFYALLKGTCLSNLSFYSTKRLHRSIGLLNSRRAQPSGLVTLPITTCSNTNVASLTTCTCLINLPRCLAPPPRTRSTAR